MLYVSDNPIDDQSNFHVPLAQLTALHANINRTKNAKPFKLTDFMLFRKQEEQVSDIEQQLLSGDW